MTLDQLVRQNPIRAVRTAHLDDAHVGDIVGALGTIRQGAARPRGLGRLLSLLAIIGPGLIVAVLDGEPRRTLRLAGSAAAIRQSMGARQPPSLAAKVAIGYALRESELETDDRPAETGETAGGAVGLTAREREVAAMIAEGLTNRQIGSQLGISVRTAEYHVEQVRAKLGYRSRRRWRPGQAGLSARDGTA